MATSFPNFALPRVTAATGSVILDTATIVSASLFEVTGDPIIIWSLDAQVVTAMGGANHQWVGVITPTDNPAIAEDLWTVTSTFFTSIPINNYWGIDHDVGLSMVFPGEAPIRFNALFARIVPPCTITHVNRSTGGTGAFHYRIIWSPLSTRSTVRAL